MLPDVLELLRFRERADCLESPFQSHDLLLAEDRDMLIPSRPALKNSFLHRNSRSIPIPYLLNRSALGLAEHEQRALADLRVRYRRLFETDASAAETFLFRLSIAGPPTARSLRRRLEDILVLA
ncbi:MAG TPA: hypothetical protein VFG23_04555 [Polyangia bacterium]|nr:hypothetical protein [Polyangia bacterium]